MEQPPAPSPARSGARTRAAVVSVRGDRATCRDDVLASEEPLEIRVSAGGARRNVAVTMRTPGHDFELAVGFLFGEGVVRGPRDVRRVRYCVDRELSEEQRWNTVTVDLTAAALPDLDRLERHFSITSACGVCGKESLDALEARGLRPVPAGPPVAPEVLAGLPAQLRTAQAVFEDTGGLHAAAVFTPRGELVAVREDVGRHNALDKLVGWSLLERGLPLGDGVVLVSGRASFELVQKCVAAGVSTMAAVSAPSSLAVDTARRFGLTLVGFLRGDRFNIYTGEHRVRPIGTSSG
ncbi:MAG: formate dehydrogenase accessory sulfurtransferase FdhD [Actinobacteria bacterium]|nr:formate dehydrogenase accessory sulfurtransferase FdhD [Actinomycetota bacterium]